VERPKIAPITEAARCLVSLFGSGCAGLGEWVEDVCAERTENTHYSPRKEAVFPTADWPDF